MLTHRTLAMSEYTYTHTYIDTYMCTYCMLGKCSTTELYPKPPEIVLIDF